MPESWKIHFFYQWVGQNRDMAQSAPTPQKYIYIYEYFTPVRFGLINTTNSTLGAKQLANKDIKRDKHIIRQCKLTNQTYRKWHLIMVLINTYIVEFLTAKKWYNSEFGKPQNFFLARPLRGEGVKAGPLRKNSFFWSSRLPLSEQFYWVFSKSLNNSYIVTHYVKRDKTLWTYSIAHPLQP